MGYAQDILVACPHGCVNRLRARVEMNGQGVVLGITFQGHEQTHNEWTGRKLEPDEVGAHLREAVMEPRGIEARDDDLRRFIKKVRDLRRP